MCEAKPNYFTCTLGEAAILKKHDNLLGPSFKSVLQLVEGRARDNRNSPALGFANPQEKLPSEEPDFTSFAELDELSRVAASELRQILPKNRHGLLSSTVGLFCYSSLDLVLSWLGLLRLGRTAFFFAPQLEVHAVEHLCQEVGVQVIIVDKAHEVQLSQIGGDIHITKVPNYHEKRAPKFDIAATRTEAKSMSSVAFLQHTSGTSSGLPKPIIQTEWGAVGCLPVFTDRKPKATFTTTPFYHGGLADTLRAWTSGAMIWFFPEGAMPVTGNNLMLTIDAARRRSGEESVKYFSSVPYVLQMLAEVEGGAGVELLQSMDLVGVGGAPLSQAVGDSLVKSGVKLLSRMGSAECGFLMSSHREYARDNKWEYLRVVNDPKLLTFESREDGLSELVVKHGWPLRLKTNCEDGSYATADLFEPHPLVPNAWRYRGRADGLIILANGKKFDPLPIEDELRSFNKMIQDALVFGAGRSYPGAILFTHSRGLSDNEYLERVWPGIEKLNSLSPHHSRLSPLSIVIVRIKEGEEPLPKSSKGTVIRRLAESRYAEAINKIYASPRTDLNKTHLADDELIQYISELFREILGRQIDPAEDIYSQGVDSITCVRITKQIQTALLPSASESLPQNIIYNNGTILALVNTLKRIRRGDSSSDDDHEGPLKLMRRLVEKYARVGVSEVKTSKKQGIVVVLTGATGGLGAHVLNELISDSRVAKVYCLLRGQSRFAAKERVFKALIKRKLRTEKELQCSGGPYNKILCLPGDLAALNLGLSDEDRSCIINDATHIIHSAWTVNFNLGLQSFESQLANTRDLIEIAHAGCAEFFFISSTAAVCNTVASVVPERVSSEPKDASATGYSRSKWVAERICAAAYARTAEAGSPGSVVKPRVSIIRVGQLCGNRFGVWNTSEAYPLLLSTAKLISRLPDLPGESLSWLPVDAAAMAVIEIALPNGIKSTSTQSKSSDIPVYHVLNPHRWPSWGLMLEWLSRELGSIPFEIISVSEWMELLEAALTRDPASKHPCQALIEMWKRRYVPKRGVNSTGFSTRSLEFEIISSQRASQSILNIEPLNRQQVVQMWEWIQENC
ncbi:hypothetical protein F5Y12DRAFT_794552 [Xylaria sp. FL1777]|nr:hypothetical protein F5Y12DRAFT_794552 [Xylaria sp. FL1777]